MIATDLSATKPTVVLSPDEIEMCLRNAEVRYKKFQNFAFAHFKNGVAPHFTGAMGELGVQRWAESVGLQPQSIFDDPRDHVNTGCDIVFGSTGLRVEVKSYKKDAWYVFGPRLKRSQFPLIMKHSDVLVWCMVQSWRIQGPLSAVPAAFPDGLSVQLMGYSNVHALLNTQLVNESDILYISPPPDEMASVTKLVG